MNAGLMKREVTANKFIPYGVHISDSVIATKNGDFLCVYKISGASFETIDDEQINNYHNRLNNLYRNIGSPNLTIYQHIIRREENKEPELHFQEGSFASDFSKMYSEKLKKDKMFINELYLTILYRPDTSFFEKMLFNNIDKMPRILTLLGLSRSALEMSLEQEQNKACETLQKISSVVETSLKRYDPELLTTYEYNQFRYSSTLEFLAYIINGEWQRMRVPDCSIDEYLLTSRPLFGTENFELRMPTSSTFGAVLGIKEYPSTTYPGFLNTTLVLPFNFVITQSFSFQYKESAKTKIKIQRNRLENSQDDAVSQIESLTDALDDVTSNKYSFGNHHMNMIVYGANIKEVNDNVGEAKTALGESGILVSREDAALEAAFWAQLPGNMAWRPRVATINSRNFAAAAPLHNYPTGRLDGNHWGPALLTLKTSSGAPYHFSYHASDPLDPDGGSRKDVGHTVVLGPSGSGKTVFTNVTMVMLESVGATKVAFTKDYDSALTIMGTGGTYLPLHYGTKTGFNPFALEETPGNKAFLADFLRQILKRTDRGYTPDEEIELSQALDILLSLPKGTRRLQRLSEGLGLREGGLQDRLKKWIYDGEFSWVFDNEEDSVINVIHNSHNIGFDITDFLDNQTIKTPIGMYLFHLINRLLDGRRFALYISEFWKLLSDDYFASFAKDHLKTMRKKNGIVVLDSQEISDVFASSISRTLIEQTATKVLFPNPDAREEDYIDGMNCTERELWLIKEGMEVGQRQFLVKQGRHSVVCQLDLKGERFFLDIVSTRRANLEIVMSLRQQFGIEPQKWLPRFKERYN